MTIFPKKSMNTLNLVEVKELTASGVDEQGMIRKSTYYTDEEKNLYVASSYSTDKGIHFTFQTCKKFTQVGKENFLKDCKKEVCEIIENRK